MEVNRDTLDKILIGNISISDLEYNLNLTLDKILIGNISISDLEYNFNLTSDEVAVISQQISSVFFAKNRIFKILSFAQKRSQGIFFSDDYLNPPLDENDKWSFISNLSYDHHRIFYDCEDNHAVASLLRKEGVLGDNVDDPEMCCYYAYFLTEKDAKDFINRLNIFINKRLGK